MLFFSDRIERCAAGYWCGWLLITLSHSAYEMSCNTPTVSMSYTTVVNGMIWSHNSITLPLHAIQRAAKLPLRSFLWCSHSWGTTSQSIPLPTLLQYVLCVCCSMLCALLRLKASITYYSPPLGSFVEEQVNSQLAAFLVVAKWLSCSNTKPAVVMGRVC